MNKETDIKATVLDKAREIVVDGERADRYGKPEDSFSRIAKLWTAYLAGARNEVTALDVGNMMCLLKIARSEADTGYLDNYIDLAGYAACAGEIGANMAGIKVSFADTDPGVREVIKDMFGGDA